MVKCIKELDRIDRRKQQWRYRPVVPVKTACKEWWKYAARCHLGRDALKPKPSWKNVFLRARENICYVQAYAKLLGTNEYFLITSRNFYNILETMKIFFQIFFC